MKTGIYVLSALIIVLWGLATAFWLSPAPDVDVRRDVRHGLHEGLELVAKRDGQGHTHHIVVDAKGRKLFSIPVRNCLLDVRFRDGKLRFRERATGRTGYVGRDGSVAFEAESKPATPEQSERERATISPRAESNRPEMPRTSKPSATAGKSHKLDDETLRQLKANHPFFQEAAKVLSGQLDVNDAERRKVILNYCEHFRTAYTSKDIDFLRQVFSDQALIIVGNVVKATDEAGGYAAGERVELFLRTKAEYLARLARAFSANKRVDVRFSDFHILRHPAVEGIYGVSLRQRYASDNYADDGWLFLLWDFRDETMPLIHVRTWQPAETVDTPDDIINMGDFNLQ